jgi:hypothetical protein
MLSVGAVDERTAHLCMLQPKFRFVQRGNQGENPHPDRRYSFASKNC